MSEILEKRSGYREVAGPSGKLLVVYSRLSVLGWYYVVTASGAELRVK